MNRDLEDFDAEWLETNGLGGFASSTICGRNSRRYHGLLVAALDGPVRRFVLLSKFEETLTVGGERFELSTNQYPGVIHPAGYRYLVEHSMDPMPTFWFEVAGFRVQKRVFMVHGENTTVVQYDITDTQAGGRGYTFELRPLIAFRDYHSIAHANGALNGRFEEHAGRVTVRPYADLPELHFAHNGSRVDAAGNWYYNFEYKVEQERGFYECEDLFNPFVLRFEGNAGETHAVVVSTREHTAGDATRLFEGELARRNRIRAKAASGRPLVVALTKAADQFLVKRGGGHTVIAGYHWFTDWGRDTMISLPGLAIATGRTEMARDILRTFARSVDQGMIPNRFADGAGLPEWNTVDASLWMFEAARAYVANTGDWSFVRDELYQVLVDMVEWHCRGTRYGIHIDANGLLTAGEAGVPLTWMDAKVGDTVFTPRDGKPVEIQALWHNALLTLKQFAEQFGDGELAKALQARAQLAARSFGSLFWNAEAGCLFDVVSDNYRDAAIRPNQVFAMSLHYPLLEGERAVSALRIVEEHLLTPRGLRTLSPQDPKYRPRYGGDIRSRDSAYHQGTVWPWLAGPFFKAWLRVHGATPETVSRIETWLRDFEPHLGEAGLGQVSEVFDGDPPQRPGGCIAQAWSVAELLRLAVMLGRLFGGAE
ncbi:MAG: glycogen debranching enzyme N-terminal domain-containing protein [Acidobacteriaceae bacterium]|nr:glycogen debranching enzyme N-terminal domain-containing protein [Acidobacteriaceae bacterium]